MSYYIPLDQPLTESQSELTAKMGSMKNLLSLKFFKRFNIPKSEQISTFDYVLKVLRSMGIDPTILLKSFLNNFFATEKLVELILRASAHLAVGTNIILNPNSGLSITSSSTKEQKKEAADENFKYLNDNSTGLKQNLTHVVNALKIQMIKDLMTLIFGAPKKDIGKSTMSEYHDTTYDRLNELVNESYCGTEVFSVSTPSNIRNEDVEYNRIKLREKAKAGKISFTVTCQGVEISLPDDPGYLFNDAPPGFSPSSSVSPSNVLTNCINHVANQMQKNTKTKSASTSSSSQKSFVQLIVEKLIVHIPSLLKPLLMGVTTQMPQSVPSVLSNGYDGILKEIQNKLLSEGRNSEASIFEPSGLYPSSSCEMTNDWDSNPDNWTPEQKKKSMIVTILCNMALNIIIGLLVAELIKRVKAFISKYIATRAINKAMRKTEKLKQRFSLNKFSSAAEKAQKAQKQAMLLKNIEPAIKASKNYYL